ncbi:hypothetical protein DRO19_02705, partial [Candidatus Bathyarchaeota archaeon]
VKKVKPRAILFLGDVKHTIAKAEVEEWRDIPEFFEVLLKNVKEIMVIPGNHDGNLEPLLPEEVKILPSTGIKIEDTGFFHGHTWPSPELLECKNLVIGHLHPVVVFRDPLGFKITSQVWVKAKCSGAKLAEALLRRLHERVGDNPVKTFEQLFHKTPRVSQIFIMPAFNDFLGGQPINVGSVNKEEKYREFIGPILRSGTVDINSAEVYMLDGTFLGTIHQLRTLV